MTSHELDQELLFGHADKLSISTQQEIESKVNDILAAGGEARDAELSKVNPDHRASIIEFMASRGMTEETPLTLNAELLIEKSAFLPSYLQEKNDLIRLHLEKTLVSDAPWGYRLIYVSESSERPFEAHSVFTLIWGEGTNILGKSQDPSTGRRSWRGLTDAQGRNLLNDLEQARA